MGTNPPATTTSHGQKSYRRKYRKSMVKFDESVRENTSLFKESQKLASVSLRIAEETDQLLELLLELNEHPQVPPSMRFFLDDIEPQIFFEGGDDAKDATLRKARHKLLRGDMGQEEYEDIQRQMLVTKDEAALRQYSDLYNGLQISAPTATEADGMHGLLSSKEEQQYLQSLDDLLDGRTTNPRGHAIQDIESYSASKGSDRHRNLALHNPVSVYNWLCKHRPSVFMDTVEHETAKVAARRDKRPATTKSKEDKEMYDEDGFALDHGMSKNKRKRDEDGGYRPKGGHSRPTKRRKEDGRRSKRGSMDMTVG